MESDKYICTRDSGNVVIINMDNPDQVIRRQISAESALMNPNSMIIALKAPIKDDAGSNQDSLQIFNLEMKSKVTSYVMKEKVVFWKWINSNTVGIVTNTAVYHWVVSGQSEPEKVFDRLADLNGFQIINYRTDEKMTWSTLIGIAPGAPERPQLVKGKLQLYSFEKKQSQALDAHAAAFAYQPADANGVKPLVLAFAQKSLVNGQVEARLHVITLSPTQGKKTSRSILSSGVC